MPRSITAWIKIVPGEGRIGIDRLRVSKTADLSTADIGQVKADPEKANEWQKLDIKHTFSETDLAGPVFVGFRHFGFPGTVHVDAISVVADSP